MNRIPYGLITSLLLCAGTPAFLHAVENALTDKELQAQFPADLGPSTIDVSNYAPYHQLSYQKFIRTCSVCHSPARAINSPLVKYDDWDRYLHRMHLRAQKQLLANEDARQLAAFLTFDAKVRKVEHKKEFDELQKQLKVRFEEIQKARPEILRKKKQPTQESAPYTGTP